MCVMLFDQNVIDFLDAGHVENLVGGADALLREIDKLAEHVAGRKIVRVCHSDKAF